MNILFEVLRSCFEIIITSTNMLARRRSLTDAQYLLIRQRGLTKLATTVGVRGFNPREGQ